MLENDFAVARQFQHHEANVLLRGRGSVAAAGAGGEETHREKPQCRRHLLADVYGYPFLCERSIIDLLHVCSSQQSIDPVKASNPFCLEFLPESECAGVVVELIITDHGTEAHEWLPAIGKNGHEASAKIEVVSDWDLVLKCKLHWIRSLVLCELDSNVPL